MDNESTLAIIQASAFHGQFFSGTSLPEIFLHGENRKSVSHRPQSPEKASGLEMNFRMSNCSSVSCPTNGLGFQVPAYDLYEEGHSVIGSKPEFCNFVHDGAFLNFELNTKVMPTNNLHSRMTSKEDWMNFPKCFAADNILSETSSCHHAAVILNDRENVINKGIQELGRRDTSKNKCPGMGDGVQELKKPCVVSSTKPKTELTAKKDTLSIAAKVVIIPGRKLLVHHSAVLHFLHHLDSQSDRAPDPAHSFHPDRIKTVSNSNRRERISQRLKVLQELVPNGSKVDLVTMLEKAISYVKFLQLQVKVLANDEFWPSQGGKAPELSQVKEAIDAILGS